MERQIEVFHAAANNDFIRFYSNKAPNCYCEGKIIDNTHAIIEWKEEEILEQGETTINKTSFLKKMLAKLKALNQLIYMLKIWKALIKMLIFFLIFPVIPLYGNEIDFMLLLLTT